MCERGREGGREGVRERGENKRTINRIALLHCTYSINTYTHTNTLYHTHIKYTHTHTHKCTRIKYTDEKG